MKVETYETEEITGELGVMAADSESMEIINKLGLKGQLALSNPKTDTRQPYRQMTQLERNVFSTLFPQRTYLDKFSQGPIPLRVLQVAAHANECGLFKRLEVWHPTEHREKDPVLAGISQHHEYTWQETVYLLARWGDALPSFEELAEKAKKLWIVQTGAKLRSLKIKLDGDIQRLENIAELGFSGGVLEDLSYNL